MAENFISKPNRLRELAKIMEVSRLLRLQEAEVSGALREYAALLDEPDQLYALLVKRGWAQHEADDIAQGRIPQEASGIPSDDLRRLWNAEVDDADKLLTALGLGATETISEQYRSEGGFLRVGKIVSALKERGIPHEPGEGWISVTDRLPVWTDDGRKFVLAYSDTHDWGGTQFAVMRQADFHALDIEGDGEPGTYDARVVTHWKELRAPQTKGEGQ